ncbi:PTS mannose/fructose/sorbose/N-acetylgalactosamine transporter subunit IIC [Corticicoccus populi]|uniref:PTS mannose/fructose/sorbose/N-acetylgalactosamine transporter subunit IIC n=1 Tax=Corticicoccus populi TaxID=1812821 RepID=A0ABW5WXT8_9STAP
MMTIILITLVAFILGVDDVSTKFFRRPLLIAPIIGWILGDLQAGLIIGATLEIMWMGIGNVGAYMAPDIITGTIISTALAIMSTSSVDTAVATAITLAIPTSLLAQQLLVMIQTVNVSLNGWAKRLAENADVKGTVWLIYPPAILTGAARAVPTFVALYFGAGAIQTAVDALPEFVVGGLETAGAIIPAVGIALLMTAMIKKFELWMFLILGFVFSAYLGLEILPMTLIAIVFGFFYEMIKRNSENAAKDRNTPANTGEEEYDL